MGGNTNLDSLWWRTYAVPRRPELPGSLAADVAVVGGGMTGLTAAVLLARAGLRVVVLEAERLGAGTSGGTSAHVTQVLDHRYHDLVSTFGCDGARQVAVSTHAALERIAAFVREGRIACDFARVPGWLYTESDDDVAAIEEELAAAREAGVAAERDDRTGLPFRVAAAVRFDAQARFHPTRYLAGLARLAEQAGARIFERSRVRDLQPGAPCRLETDRGTVAAGAVLLATHTPTAGINLLQFAVEPMRSYVLALRLRGGARPPDGLFWDTEDPYHYTRLQPGPRGPWLVVGGADHKTGHRRDTEDCYHDVEDYARERWPVAAVEHRWSSQFYEPADGLPFIGPSPIAPHVYVATGFSGTGLVLATLSAMVLCDELQGRRGPWADVYASRRLTLAGGPGFLAKNLDTAYHFVGDRLGVPRLDDLGRIAPGEARVVDWRGHTVAAYREESGKLHAVSAICTHLFCLVGWNSAEKTWDCPCHGGRYRPDGSVIEGPPVADLAPLEVDDA